MRNFYASCARKFNFATRWISLTTRPPCSGTNHISRTIMSRIAQVYRKYWPTEAVLRGKLVLEDLMLCSFSRKELVEIWDTSTDMKWGGKSQATVTWQPWETKGDGIDVQPWRLVKGKPAKAAPLGMLQSEKPLAGDEEDTAPPLESGGFFRFAGELDVDKTARAKIGGFCGTRPPRRDQPLVLPDGYEGVEIRIRTDGRLYEINFEPQSGILNDLYQGYLRTPPGEWTTLALPLKRLLLTGQGQIRDVQRKWDRHMELRSIGFTIADPVGGPFQLDVAWIALVSKVDMEGEIDEKGQRPRKKPSRPQNGVMTW